MGFMRRKILVLLPVYLPGFKAGGPLQSVANIVENLGNEFDFWIITSDRDLGDSAAYPNIALERWHRVGAASVIYLPKGYGSRALAELIRGTSHDQIYLNSFFSFNFSILPLLLMKLGVIPRVRTVLAPRGEFSRGALAIKPIKKKLFITASKLSGLHEGVTWQASSDYERADIKRVLGVGEQRIRIASNLSRVCIRVDTHRPSNRVRIAFISRISPKKNLSFALEALARVRSEAEFFIYGPIEDLKYWAQCQAQMKSLPANIKVSYEGVLEPSTVVDTVGRFDLFFLPTKGENFGHVISESLSAGTPVLISDQTPWRHLKATGVGADLPLADVSAFSLYIDEFCGKSADVRERQRLDVIRYFLDRRRSARDIDANRVLFC